MDPFQRFPWLVLRRVLLDLPDLQSLYRIRCGSPAVAAFLRQDAGSFTTIIEAITSYHDDTSGLFPSNQIRIRNLVLWWWWVSSKSSHLEPNLGRSPVPQSVEDVLRFSFGNIINKGPISPPSDAIFGQKPLPLSTPPILLFRLLALSNRIRQIVHTCFHDLIASCMSLKPEHMENPRSKFRNKASRPITHRSARPYGLAYLPVDIGPPSWREEQLIMGALLAIIVSMELRATLLSRGDLGVGEEARRFVCDNPGIDFWEGAPKQFLSRDEHEQVTTVFSWLRRKSKGPASIRSWVISAPISASFISCCPKFTVPRAPDPDQLNDSDPYRSVGFQCMFHCRMFAMSPLRCVNESIFRPYGLAIWEAERLEAFGLLPEGKHPQVSNYHMYFAWSSILTEDQWDQLIRLQTVTPYDGD